MVQMARQEVWRLQYRSDPYLRDLSNDALLTRAGDLTSAMWVYTPEGLIACKSIEQDSSQMERFAHVLEELMIRGLSYKQDPVREALNIPKPEKVRRALKVLASRTLPEPILVKFGPRQHVASLLLEGKGRISPASYYNDPSLGRARADNEARVTTYVHPSDAHRYFGVRHTADGSSTAVDLPVPYRGSTPIEITATTDFYVYCMASTCDARMFEDFDQTCVVITDPVAFTAKLRDAVNTVLPGWQFVAAPVEYIDPFFARPHQLAAHISKHFRYSYQKEYRFLWLPPSQEEAGKWPWDHIAFQLGPLTSYAELIWL
jgi:hypothetical protein